MEESENNYDVWRKKGHKRVNILLFLLIHLYIQNWKSVVKDSKSKVMGRGGQAGGKEGL